MQNGVRFEQRTPLSLGDLRTQHYGSQCFPIERVPVVFLCAWPLGLWFADHLGADRATWRRHPSKDLCDGARARLGRHRVTRPGVDGYSLARLSLESSLSARFGAGALRPGLRGGRSALLSASDIGAHQIDKLPCGVRRGHPVGALATSCGGGGIAADRVAACPVRLLSGRVQFARNHPVRASWVLLRANG